MSKIGYLIELLCPEGLEFKELGEIVEILDSQRKPVSKSQRVGGKYPYYGANGIQDYVDDYIFDGTFILLGEDGSVINKDGTPVLNWATGKIWVNNHAHILAEKSDIAILRYVYFALAIIDVTKVVKGNIPKITQQNIRGLQIPLPPLPIQQEIVNILDKFTELQAELQAELEARKKQYEYYRNKLLTFEDGEVEWKTLGEVGEVTKLAGFEFTEHIKYADDGSIIALRGLNIKKGRLDLSNVKFIDKSNFAKLSRSRLYINDMLFTYVGTIGEVALIEENNKYYLAPNVARIRFIDKKINPVFMRYYFQSEYFIDKQINRYLSTSSMKNLTMVNIRKFQIPIPPLAEQERIVAILDKFDALVNDMSVGLPAEIEARRKQYEYYRGRLLDFKALASITDKGVEISPL